MQDQSDARSIITFPAAPVGHHSSLTSANLYSLMPEAHLCEQLNNLLMDLSKIGMAGSQTVA